MEVDAKVVRRGANAILVFVFTHFDFPDQKFYAAKPYIHVTKEVGEYSLFVLAEAFIPASSAEVIDPLAVDGNNRVDGAEENYAPILLSGRTSNLHSEDIVDLRHQGISINDGNKPAPENVPRQGETTTGTGNCRIEGIICPRESGNLQKSFRFFQTLLS